MLGEFLNIFAPYDKSSALNREYLRHPVMCNYLKRKKNFSQYFSTFSKSRLNFEHIQRKDDTHS